MKHDKFHRVRKQVLEFHHQGHYREALEVALRAQGHFPEK